MNIILIRISLIFDLIIEMFQYSLRSNRKMSLDCIYHFNPICRRCKPTLEMIFGATTDANSKSQMQKQLHNLKKTVLEEGNLE